MAKKKLKLKRTEFTPKLFFAVRIRGAPGMRGKIRDTLEKQGIILEDLPTGTVWKKG